MQRENKWQERFDEKFGKMSDTERECYEDDAYHYTDNAGCDGCDYNVWWREQIKKFIQSELDTAIAEERERVVKILKDFKVVEDFEDENWEEENWIINQHIDKIIKELTGK